MPYSTNLKIDLMVNGTNSNTWGTVTNTNLGTALEQAIVGKADITMSSTTVTLTYTDTNAAQDARAIYLNLSGSPGGAATLVVPAIQKPYIVKNGSDAQVTIKVSGQTGVIVPVGKTVLVYNNGTDVVTSVDHIPSLTLASALPVASGGTGITAFGTGVATALGVNTGSAGAFVVNGGALGTPSSGTLTSATGLPVSTGIAGLGTNVATALAVNVGSSGAVVVNGGALGTPSSGTLTNATGLPISTGVSGLGTNVATALAVNVGSSGAVVVNGGALGTPSSGTLTNATGLPVSTGIAGLGTNVATALSVNVGSVGAFVVNGGALGSPSSGTLTNATGLPISTGVAGLGTGVATALGQSVSGSGGVALTTSPVFTTPNLGTPSAATLTSATGLPIDAGTTGTLPVARGGTGITAFGTGVATALGQNVTGSGGIVLATNPTIDRVTVTGNAQTTPVAVAFSATTMAVDCTESNVFTTTFTANVTVAPALNNPQDGQTINWFITQDGTGGRTMTWPTSFKWPLGASTVLSISANAVDLVTATYRSATGFWYATLLKGFA